MPDVDRVLRDNETDLPTRVQVLAQRGVAPTTGRDSVEGTIMLDVRHPGRFVDSLRDLASRYDTESRRLLAESRRAADAARTCRAWVRELAAQQA